MGDTQYVLDAKYKSHMFNQNDAGEILKDTFRHDLHQILAYCSFNTMTNKKSILVYPFVDFTLRKLRITSPLQKASADVYLLGLPLTKNKFEETKENIQEFVLKNSDFLSSYRP